MGDHAGALAAAWIARLPVEGGVDLANPEALATFPELVDRVTPPEYGLTEVEGFVAGDASDGMLEVEFLARLVPPPTPPAAPDAPAAFGLVDFSLDTETRELRLDTLDIPDVMQQGGLGRRQMLQLVLLADDLGLDAIRLEAGKVGRWAWMRCGFDFEDAQWRDITVAAAQDFATRLGRDIDLSTVEHSWDFLNFTDPVATHEIEAAGGPLIAGGSTVPLGKALLLGPPPTSNAWYGRLELQSQSAGRVRLGAYVLGDGNPDSTQS